MKEADDSRRNSESEPGTPCYSHLDALLSPTPAPSTSPNFPGKKGKNSGHRVKPRQVQRSLLCFSLADPTGTLTREDKSLKACPKPVVPGWGRTKARSVSSAKPIWHHRQLAQGMGCSACCESLQSFPFQGLGEFISSAISEDACLARDCFAELRKIRKWLAGFLVEEGRIA